MAKAHYKALLGKVLLGFITEQNPVLAILEGVAQMMMRTSSLKNLTIGSGTISGDQVRTMENAHPE